MTLDELDQHLRAQGEVDANIEFIRQTLQAPSEVASLAIDVYQDPVTGATLGVPAGTALAWNDAKGMLEAVAANGVVRMFIGVARAASHAEALRNARAAFIGRLLELADWQVSPESLELRGDGDWASNACFFDGIDVTGQPAQLNVSITVSGPASLCYALYGPRRIEELPAAELVTYLMMQFAVQKLQKLSSLAPN